jgi:hypothetical protein
MSLEAKRIVIILLAVLFLGSLIYVQKVEVARKRHEAGLDSAPAVVPQSSKACVDCHREATPGLISHWEGSTHAEKGVGCVECHAASDKDADGFSHYGAKIATIVTPRDCGRCHVDVAAEFAASHHAKAGNILASLDNFLAETVEGARVPFDPHSPTPGRPSTERVNGGASAASGCKQCHGTKVGLMATDGGVITVDDLEPGPEGAPKNAAALARIARDPDGKPSFDSNTWPSTGIGRINLDGSRGSCSACHSRHDFSPRRARQPENCGKCHLGPDHPQKEIYEESKHGVAFRDLREEMHLDGKTWILGKDYAQAPTCATCHMSGNSRNGGKVTHDPGIRISWTNRPPVSLVMDTDLEHAVVTATDPAERRKLTVDGWQDKRGRMKEVCTHCHSGSYVDLFYAQYDDFITLYNEKFGKPGQQLMKTLAEQGLITRAQFDDEIEWTWFYLWHHEGRRARHGVSMMAPDYAHWHGMFEVAERFYKELVPQARELIAEARGHGKAAQATAAQAVLDGILARPEHDWLARARSGADLGPQPRHAPTESAAPPKPASTPARIEGTR